MSNTISILGCGRSGVQTSTLLLERYFGTILLYDKDVEYAKGMALDCMQAASVVGYHSQVSVVDSIEELKKSQVLIVCEYRDESSIDAETLKNLIQEIPVCVYACNSTSLLEQVATNKILGVHGMVDASVVISEVSRETDISKQDIQVMLKGGVREKMDSDPNFIRVCGIPINEIKAGVYETALARAREFYTAFQEGPWNTYYSFAAAASELALILVSGQGALLPITIGSKTIPAMVKHNGYEEISL